MRVASIGREHARVMKHEKWHVPTEREPRTAIFLFLRASAGITRNERGGNVREENKMEERDGEKDEALVRANADLVGISIHTT